MSARRIKALFVIEEEHATALREEAFARALEAGVARPDGSAVLREILDGWVKRRHGARAVKEGVVRPTRRKR